MICGRIMNKLDTNIILMNDDMWWTKGDILGYKKLKEDMEKLLPKILKYLKNKNVCVQAGGHCGRMVLELKKHFKTIYTFEPNPTMHTCLCMNIPDPNVFKIQACIGNEHKMVGMVKNGNWGDGGNFVQGNGNIPMLLIDDLALNECDFIQLDLEGYEYYALLGAEKTIDKFRPLLCVERGWGEAHTGISEEKTSEFLDKYNYELMDKELWPDHIYKCKVF